MIKTDRASSLRVALGDLAKMKEGLALISRQKHLVIINNKLFRYVRYVGITLIVSIETYKEVNSISFNLKQEVFIRRDED